MNEPSIFKKYVVDILKFVDEKNTCQKSDIYDHINQHSAPGQNAVNSLIKMGLLSESKRSNHNAKWISITAEGHMALEHIKFIETIKTNGIGKIADDRNQSSPSQSDVKPVSSKFCYYSEKIRSSLSETVWTLCILSTVC